MSLQLTGGLLAYSYTLGIFALLSPCGYALLPGYASYWMGSKASPERALSGGIISTLGFISTFLILGLLISAVGAILTQYLPWVEIIAASLVIVLGLLLLFEVRMPTFNANPGVIWRKDYAGMYGFGLTYGLAATGCSAPIFFAIIAQALAQGTLMGAGMMTLYGVGMGSAFIITAVLAAQGRAKAINKINRITPLLHKASAIALIIAGLYTLWFNLQAASL